ncbi:MAG: hypothetical protein ABEN55_13455 [Bradymonadaceae bacterium]
MRRSTCCDAPVTAEGETTRFWTCTECGRPCGVKPEGRWEAARQCARGVWGAVRMAVRSVVGGV